jgi:hypothetical protein
MYDDLNLVISAKRLADQLSPSGSQSPVDEYGSTPHHTDEATEDEEREVQDILNRDSLQHVSNWKPELEELLVKYNWKVCTCPTTFQCNCGRPLIPQGVVHEASSRITTNPGFHCLSFARIRDLMPGFDVGLRQTLLACGILKDSGPASSWRFLSGVASQTLAITIGDQAAMDGNEQFLREQVASRKVQPKSLGFVIAGSLCVDVLQGCTATWNLLASHFSTNNLRTEDSEVVLRGVQDAMATYLALVDNTKQWLSSLTASSHPFSCAVLEESIYWCVQHILFLVHAYTLIRTYGWLLANQVYQDGGMPWQVGWVNAPKSCFSYFGKLLCR